MGVQTNIFMPGWMTQILEVNIPKLETRLWFAPFGAFLFLKRSLLLFTMTGQDDKLKMSCDPLGLKNKIPNHYDLMMPIVGSIFLELTCQSWLTTLWRHLSVHPSFSRGQLIFLKNHSPPKKLSWPCTNSKQWLKAETWETKVR